MGGWSWCVEDRVSGGLVLVCRRQGRGGWCWCVGDRVGGGGAGV